MARGGRTDPPRGAGRAAGEDIPDRFQAFVPRVLPADVADFTGRTKEFEQLRDLLTQERGEVRVAAVSGAAGVGKTAVCIHVAHQLRDDFPDGQLFANLHGVDADAAVTPFELLGRFLRSFGVDGLAVPSTLDERVELYRGLLADRKVLVVLDNAGTADQVLPLIPGSPTCAVLINGRTRLAYAVGAIAVNLDVLDPPQAADLLARIAGNDRLASQPDAVAQLTRLCGYLPLALRVAAAKLAAKPQLSIRSLVDRLSDERRRLDQFTYGHLDVRSSISLSYDGLTQDGRRLLRRLGDVDLPEVTVWASAALLDTSTADAEEALEQLYDAQLVDIAGWEVTGHARYRLHDLVRLLAKERADADEPAEELGAARARVLGAWLYVAEAAYRTVFGDDLKNIPRTAARWVFGHDLAARLVADPGKWFESERHSIVSMIGLAAGHGHVSAKLGTRLHNLAPV